jgi:broad specificity phosphatase PhoE
VIWLVRHPQVALHWQNRCYGVSDMGLSREGARLAKQLVSDLVGLSPDVIVHSDMRRTRYIAEQVASSLSIKASADSRWRERDFGSWEGHSWDAIYRETGNAMDGMLDNPDGFRPGGGETTTELVARVLFAWRDLPTEKTVAVITHGGPIAAILANQNNAPLRSLPDYIPALNSVSRL